VKRPEPDHSNSLLSAEELRSTAEKAIEDSVCETPPTEGLSLHQTQSIMHDLQVLQVELEMQNEELEETHQKLEAERSFYYDLYDLAPVGYATLRTNNLIEQCNLALSRLLGVTQVKLAQESLLDYIHGSDRAAYLRHHRLVCSSGEIQVDELRMVGVHGKEIWVRIESSAFDARSCTYRCIISDITRMRSERAELAELEKELTRSRELATNGTMAAEISAVIGQPMASIGESALSLETMLRELVPILKTARELSAAICSDTELQGVEASLHANELRSLLERPENSGLINRMDRAIENTKKGFGEVRSAVNSLGVFSDSSIHQDNQIVGESEAIHDCLSLLTRAAATDIGVLLTGETGTGKERFAQALHTSSGRSGPLIAVNCAALPEPLVESELFGHIKGAYTGATSNHRGKFQLADKGTLFLDEIGELSLEIQSKLLRVLQGSEYFQVGGEQPLVFKGRLVAATNANLELAVASGAFRADLYYRVNSFQVAIPPLRDRGEDIPMLLRHFIEKYARPLGREITSVSAELTEFVNSYEWPGNVRELESYVQRALICGDGPILEYSASNCVEPHHQSPHAGNESLDSVQRGYILEVLTSLAWVIEGSHGAAKRLGLKPSTLRSKMEHLGITRPGH
jgi:PAS domain S-box-containing protein